MCFNHFVKFMANSWGYLLTDNMAFWLPYLSELAQAIRDKCGEKGCAFPYSLSPGKLKYIQTCRQYMLKSFYMPVSI
jgi:hypothetical protein